MRQSDQAFRGNKFLGSFSRRTMNDIVALGQPYLEFSIQIQKIDEGFAVKKNTNVADQSLDASFFIALVRIAQVNREAIEPAEVQKLRIVFDRGRSSYHHTFEIVVSMTMSQAV